MDNYVIRRAHIEALEGEHKTHFLNDRAQRRNKSLGDLVGLTGIGFHLIEIEPGFESTEYHRHYFEDECVYILAGNARVEIGDTTHDVQAGDFIGYPAGGLAHTMVNTGSGTLTCIVVGARLDHDVVDYPRQAKRLYRNAGMDWNLVDSDGIVNPKAGSPGNKR